MLCNPSGHLVEPEAVDGKAQKAMNIDKSIDRSRLSGVVHSGLIAPFS